MTVCGGGLVTGIISQLVVICKFSQQHTQADSIHLAGEERSHHHIHRREEEGCSIDLAVEEGIDRT